VSERGRGVRVYVYCICIGLAGERVWWYRTNGARANVREEKEESAST
jgi:hypothetical protein